MTEEHKHLVDYETVCNILEYGSAKSPYLQETEIIKNGDSFGVIVPCSECGKDFELDLIQRPESTKYAEVVLF